MAKRIKTETLPGIPAQKIIKEVSEAAIAYEEARNRRMKLTEKEVESQEKLIVALIEHEIKGSYRDDSYDPPLIVEWKHSDKAKVRREKAVE